MHRIVAITMLGAFGTVAVSAQPLLQLKARPSPKRGDSAVANETLALRSLNGTRRHLVVQFAETPTAADIQNLVERGAVILQYVPDQAILISAPEGFQLDGENVILAESLLFDVKVSPELAAGAAVVEFYPDVAAADARQIASIEGIRYAEHADMAGNHLLVDASLDQLKSLAGWDEVAYIYPASAELVRAERVHPCAGAMTEFGIVGQYVAKVGEGWDGPGKNAASLKYVIAGITKKLPADTARAEILRALAQWSKVVKVDFAAGASSRDTGTINILFASGAHGDPYPFDGPGRVLAHTFYPAPPNPEPLAGDLHFDEAESWRIGNDVDLYSVALHELGHALGLAHSDKPGAVMYPYYRRATVLTDEDIAAIRTLYADRIDEPAAIPPAPAPAPPPAPAPAPAPGPNPASQDKTAPAIAIQTPQATSVQTNADAIVVKGSASDKVGVVQVTWSSNVFGTNTATGTTQWSATVPLALGQNTIIMRAYDAAGNTSWRSLVVVRK